MDPTGSSKSARRENTYCYLVISPFPLSKKPDFLKISRARLPIAKISLPCEELPHGIVDRLSEVTANNIPHHNIKCAAQ